MKSLYRNKKILTEQSVIILFEHGLPYPEALYETGFVLDTLISKEKVGYYDCHCTAEDDSHGWLYMYGPDADKLFEIVKPVLERTSILKRGIVTLEYGPPGTNAKYKIIEL